MTVIQRVSKALRFGFDETQPDQPLTNQQRIVYELSDIMAVIELLRQQGLLQNFPSGDMIEAKKLKVLKYMEYARKQGTLQ
jgi:hypothetical protein